MTSSDDTSLTKEAIQTKIEPKHIDNDLHELDSDSPAKEGATEYDIRDMNALGLAPVFKRRFKFVAMVGFCSTVVVAWQNTLTNFGFGLFDGGTGGIFWTLIFAMISSVFLYLSLCELASWYVVYRSTDVLHVLGWQSNDILVFRLPVVSISGWYDLSALTRFNFDRLERKGLN